VEKHGATILWKGSFRPRKYVSEKEAREIARGKVGNPGGGKDREEKRRKENQKGVPSKMVTGQQHTELAGVTPRGSGEKRASGKGRTRRYGEKKEAEGMTRQNDITIGNKLLE